MPGPRVSYDMKVGQKSSPRDVNKLGLVGLGLKCKALPSGESDTSGARPNRGRLVCFEHNYPLSALVLPVSSIASGS